MYDILSAADPVINLTVGLGAVSPNKMCNLLIFL